MHITQNAFVYTCKLGPYMCMYALEALKSRHHLRILVDGRRQQREKNGG